MVEMYDEKIHQLECEVEAMKLQRLHYARKTEAERGDQNRCLRTSMRDTSILCHGMVWSRPDGISFRVSYVGLIEHMGMV